MVQSRDIRPFSAAGDTLKLVLTSSACPSTMALVLGLWGGEGRVEDYGFETSQIQHPIPSHKEPGIRRQAKHGQKLSTAATKND